MTPEEKRQLEEVYQFIQLLKSDTTIPLDVDGAFRKRLASSLDLPNGFDTAPLDAITAPTGGATIDSQARTAIDTIITRLEDLGLVLPN